MKKLLLIEDDAPLVETLTEVFEDEGYEVRASYDLEALLWAREGWPDVIILDHMLPLLQGAAIMQYLQNHAATRHIPVIFATAVPNHTGATQELGSFRSINKPYSLDDLQHAVEDAVAVNWRQS